MSYFGDLKNSVAGGDSFVPAAEITSSANGVGVDMSLGDGNNAVGFLSMGVYDVSSGNETYAFSITESDDNVTFAARPVRGRARRHNAVGNPGGQIP
jgi:hypothetical protein